MSSLVEGSDFRFSMRTAFELAKNKEKAVIFYTLPRGSINRIYGVCFKRSVVDKIGGDLSRMDTEFYRTGNKMSFSDFATHINGLDQGLLKHNDRDALRISNLDITDISRSR